MHRPRRRNGSKKIPNVKLRPSTSRVTREDRARAHTPVGEEDGEPEFGGEMQVDVYSGLLPFRGVVVCATGSVDKVDLSRRIEQLGGALSKHLTDEVQFLIADTPGSDKYRFAVKHRLPVMTPSWIIDAHERYRNAEDFTLEDARTFGPMTLEGYRLPCFADLKICVSGENLLENRHKMARLMHAQGGTYMKDLNEHVTHLIICGEAQTMDDDEVRTPKLLWALEQNKARQKQRLIHRQRSERRKFIEDSFELMPDIHIVWTEWFWDCLKSGGRHLESDYSIERFRAQHTKDSPGPMMSTPSFALATTSTQPTNLPLGVDPDESLLDTEIDPVLKRTTGVHTGRDDIWSKMLKTRAATSSKTRATTISALKGKGRADLTESSSGDGRSYLDRLHLSRNLATTEQGASDAGQAARPFGRVVSSAKVRESASPGPSTSASAPSKRTLTDKKVLSGKSFAIFAETFGDVDTQFRTVIQKYGGKVCTSLTLTAEESEAALQVADFIVVRLMGTIKYGTRNSPYREKMRTECWIEHCIWAEEIVSSNVHATFKPLTAELPVPGIHHLEVAVSGLDNLELTFLERFCAVVGLKTEGKFKKATSTHLICPSKSGEKYEQALLWNKPVVDLDWVYNLGYPKPEAVAHTTADTCMMDVTNDSPPEETYANHQVAGKKRPLSAVVTLQHEAVANATAAPSDSPRKRDRKPAIRVEKTPSLTTPLETSPRVRESSRQNPSTPDSTSNTRDRPVLSMDTGREHQDAVTGKRSRNAIPSSQSPSPLKSPAAAVVRKQLAAILEIDSDEPPSNSLSPEYQLPPVRSRTGSVASGSNPSGSNLGIIRRKSRPKSVPRHKAIAGELGRSVSMSSVSSTDSRMLKSFSSAGDLGMRPGLPPVITSELDSMRVTYDDPHQRAAKRQLMDLVTPEDEKTDSRPAAIHILGSETPPSSSGPKKGYPTRRSTRMAGF